LSDDGTNRTLLRWLKLWDKLVFGKEKKAPTRPAKPENEAAGGKKFAGGD
jgi:chromosome transmission fidelity protein 18